MLVADLGRKLDIVFLSCLKKFGHSERFELNVHLGGKGKR